MEDELRLSLLIAGSCFIIAVLAHGIWKIRKNNQAGSPKRQEPRAWARDDVETDEENEALWQSTRSPYDDLGLGEVRVVSQKRDASDAHTESDIAETDELSDDAELSESHASAAAGRANEDPAEDDVEDGENATSTVPEESKLYGSVVSNPKPHMQTQKPVRSADEPLDFPEPPGFLIKDSDDTETPADDKAGDRAAEVDSFSLDAPSAEPKAQEPAQGAGFSEQAKKFVSRKRTKQPAQKRRQEPNFGDDQMRIDFDEPANTTDVQGVDEQEASQQKQSEPVEQEVLVLNVKAKADEPISGAALLPLLLTLGFKFGDQDIFHRHVNSNGKGPVLFSLANMFKPGNFDIDNLETFTTQGVSLFMILPIEGDPHQVFNMMHNAGRKIADEFGAQLLDGRRSVLTKQGLQQYTEKIREFERQRMIARH